MAPDESDRRGVLPREQPCPACDHDHVWLPCDFCPCMLHIRNGID